MLTRPSKLLVTSTATLAMAVMFAFPADGESTRPMARRSYVLRPFAPVWSRSSQPPILDISEALWTRSAGLVIGREQLVPAQTRA